MRRPLAARPPLIYWNAATLGCVDAVRELRGSGVAVFFTIDAGPQLKAVCARAPAATSSGPSGRFPVSWIRL